MKTDKKCLCNAVIEDNKYQLNLYMLEPLLSTKIR